MRDKRLKIILLKEAHQTITVRDGDRAITILTARAPMARAAVRAMAVNAAKGQHRALHDASMDGALVYKSARERDLDRRARLGISVAEPLPHPDHMAIDPRCGTAAVIGPVTRDETGDRLTPTRTLQRGRRLCYYLSNRLISGGRDPSGCRLPGSVMKATVVRLLAEHLTDCAATRRLLAAPEAGQMAAIAGRAQDLVERLRGGKGNARQRGVEAPGLRTCDSARAAPHRPADRQAHASLSRDHRARENRRDRIASEPPARPVPCQFPVNAAVGDSRTEAFAARDAAETLDGTPG